MPCTLAVYTFGGTAWKFPFSRSEAKRIVAAMRDVAGMGGTFIELTLLGDAAMAQANQQATGCFGPTNILAFPQAKCATNVRGKAASGHIEAAGLLALAPETLLRECMLYGQKAEDHAIRLLAHGVAHLAGYEHGPAMDALALCLESAGHKALLD